MRRCGYPLAPPVTHQLPPPPDDDLLSKTLHLVQNAQVGDARAWHDLDSRIRPWLQAQLGGRVLPRGIDAEDVVQEVLLYVHQSFDRFEVRPDAGFRGWLLRILTNKLADFWRRAGALKRGAGDERLLGDVTEQDEDVAEHHATPERSAEAKEIEAHLVEVQEQLSPEQRRVLDLREEQQLSFDRIASLIGQRHGEAARALYRRARERRRELMSAFDEPQT